MARRPHRIDYMILSTDQDRWREELHGVLRRRGQEQWTLVAVLNGGPREGETPRHQAIAGAVGLTLIFQRQGSRPRGRPGPAAPRLDSISAPTR
jgi:hypothetical protein